jgi:hypothetical protein
LGDRAFSAIEAADVLGRKRNGMGSMLESMRRRGLIRRVSEGRYVFSDAPAPEPSPPAPAPADNALLDAMIDDWVAGVAPVPPLAPEVADAFRDWAATVDVPRPAEPDCLVIGGIVIPLRSVALLMPNASRGGAEVFLSTYETQGKRGEERTGPLSWDFSPEDWDARRTGRLSEEIGALGSLADLQTRIAELERTIVETERALRAEREAHAQTGKLLANATSRLDPFLAAAGLL